MFKWLKKKIKREGAEKKEEEDKRRLSLRSFMSLRKKKRKKQSERRGSLPPTGDVPPVATQSNDGAVTKWMGDPPSVEEGSSVKEQDTRRDSAPLDSHLKENPSSGEPRSPQNNDSVRTSSNDLQNQPPPKPPRSSTTSSSDKRSESEQEMDISAEESVTYGSASEAMLEEEISRKGSCDKDRTHKIEEAYETKNLDDSSNIQPKEFRTNLTVTDSNSSVVKEIAHSNIDCPLFTEAEPMEVNVTSNLAENPINITEEQSTEVTTGEPVVQVYIDSDLMNDAAISTLRNKDNKVLLPEEKGSIMTESSLFEKVQKFVDDDEISSSQESHHASVSCASSASDLSNDEQLAYSSNITSELTNDSVALERQQNEEKQKLESISSFNEFANAESSFKEQVEVVCCVAETQPSSVHDVHNDSYEEKLSYHLPEVYAEEVASVVSFESVKALECEGETLVFVKGLDKYEKPLENTLDVQKVDIMVDEAPSLNPFDDDDYIDAVEGPLEVARRAVEVLEAKQKNEEMKHQKTPTPQQRHSPSLNPFDDENDETDINNVGSFAVRIVTTPIPAPRRLKPYGGMTAAMSFPSLCTTGSYNPFDDKNEDVDQLGGSPTGIFARNCSGRLSERPCNGVSFDRSPPRNSTTLGAHTRHKKKRPAPLPPSQVNGGTPASASTRKASLHQEPRYGFSKFGSSTSLNIPSPTDRKEAPPRPPPPKNF